MLERATQIILEIPESEIIDFFIYHYGECEGCDIADMRCHLVAYLRQYVRCHRVHGKVMENFTVKAYIYFNWIEYMEEKYDIGKKVT